MLPGPRFVTWRHLPYLPGQEMPPSFRLDSTKDAERQMLYEHLDQLDGNDLLVLNQG